MAMTSDRDPLLYAKFRPEVDVGGRRCPSWGAQLVIQKAVRSAQPAELGDLRAEKEKR